MRVDVQLDDDELALLSGYSRSTSMGIKKPGELQKELLSDMENIEEKRMSTVPEGESASAAVGEEESKDESASAADEQAEEVKRVSEGESESAPVGVRADFLSMLSKMAHPDTSESTEGEGQGIPSEDDEEAWDDGILPADDEDAEDGDVSVLPADDEDEDEDVSMLPDDDEDEDVSVLPADDEDEGADGILPADDDEDEGVDGVATEEPTAGITDDAEEYSSELPADGDEEEYSSELPEDEEGSSELPEDEDKKEDSEEYSSELPDDEDEEGDGDESGVLPDDEGDYSSELPDEDEGNYSSELPDDEDEGDESGVLPSDEDEGNYFSELPDDEDDGDESGVLPSDEDMSPSVGISEHVQDVPIVPDVVEQPASPSRGSQKSGNVAHHHQSVRPAGYSDPSVSLYDFILNNGGSMPIEDVRKYYPADEVKKALNLGKIYRFGNKVGV